MKIPKVLRRALALFILSGSVLGVFIYFYFRLSLALTNQTIEADLGAPVTIARDSQGVPTIEAGTRADAAFALGFVHAQDRFFQMDIYRRHAAGELAELFGDKALSLDLSARKLLLRRQAKRALDEMLASDEDLAILKAYVCGVNSGLDALKAPPPEYAILLQTAPRSWSEEDSLLVGLMMFRTLQSPSVAEEVFRHDLKQYSSKEVFEFLFNYPSVWEKPLDSSYRTSPPIPSEIKIDYPSSSPEELRVGYGEITSERNYGQPGGRNVLPSEVSLGSNACAVSSSRSRSGKAMVANDQHLRPSIPGIWYRAQMKYLGSEATTGGRARQHSLVGLTLPGLPVFTVGTNGALAWGFTNSYLDLDDASILEKYNLQRGEYLTKQGLEHTVKYQEEIKIRFGKPHLVDVEESSLGLVQHTKTGHALALRWIAREKGAVGLGLLKLERVSSVEEALDIAPFLQVPAQNMLVADSIGNIGWTIAGALFHRKGCDGSLPQSSTSDPCIVGLLSASQYPRVVNPPMGLIWSANNRMYGGDKYLALGNGGQKNDGRAWIVADLLAKTALHDEHSLFQIQSSIDALYHERWLSLAESALNQIKALETTKNSQIESILSDWNSLAESKSHSYLFVHSFRSSVIKHTVDSWLGKLSDLYPNRPWEEMDFDEQVWQAMHSGNNSIFHSGSAGREQILKESLLAALDQSVKQGRYLTWGEVNGSEMTHPLVKALPFLAPLFCFPEPINGAGDFSTPRVHNRDGVSVSMRFVVSPGNEVKGILVTPAGQSGHPLSPWYLGDFTKWNQALPTPLLPGPAAGILTLRPKAY